MRSYCTINVNKLEINTVKFRKGVRIAIKSKVTSGKLTIYVAINC